MRAIKDAAHASDSTIDIDVYDANKIKDWCNQYIAAVILVQGFNGIHRPQGFKNMGKMVCDLDERNGLSN